MEKCCDTLAWPAGRPPGDFWVNYRSLQTCSLFPPQQPQGRGVPSSMMEETNRPPSSHSLTSFHIILSSFDVSLTLITSAQPLTATVTGTVTRIRF